MLLDALESIDREILLAQRTRAGSRTETLVVDNGSVDGSVEAARASASPGRR